MKLLHLDASIQGANSASRQLSAAVVESLKQADPGLVLTYRDLAAQPLGHLSGAHLAAGQGATPESAALQEDIAAGQAALAEFLTADIVVIGAPMYNFTLPSQLKAWIDRIVVAGKTFRYTAAGPEGLAGNKRVIIAISRGGAFTAPGRTRPRRWSIWKPISKGVFGFIGLANPEFIIAEGLLLGPEQREKSIHGALEAVTQLRAA